MNFAKSIKQNKLQNKIFTELKFGLEKECIRVFNDGKMATTEHPPVFGSKIENKYFKTDFAECQIELVTPVYNSIKECARFLCLLHKILMEELEDEMAWPHSMPPILPASDEIKISNYDSSELGREANEYREYLVKKYPKKLQLLSGIHFNFSFDNELIGLLHKDLNSTEDYVKFSKELYLKIIRNFNKFSWLIIYFFGATPTGHESFFNEKIKHVTREIDFSQTISLRNSIYGYKNLKKFTFDYTDTDKFQKSILKYVKAKELYFEGENYSSIRLKKGDSTYLEVRNLDLTPSSTCGINFTCLEFVKLLLIYSLVTVDYELTSELQINYLENSEKVSMYGKNTNISLVKNEFEESSLKDWGLEIIDDMTELLSTFDIPKNDLNNLRERRDDLQDVNRIVANKINCNVEQFISANLSNAKKFCQSRNDFSLFGYEDLELSTQILLKEAIKRGLKFEILDRKENFIKISNNKKVEYIKQATKTSLDSYISYLIMENKQVTKEVLKFADINVPKGKKYLSIEGGLKDFEIYKNEKIVVKPKSTNFGIGISILDSSHNYLNYRTALELAFSKDVEILIEKFIEGQEYRFFVIGDKTEAILNRVPANVLGDGIHDIEQLVEIKNDSILRGENYQKPLQKIKLDDITEQFLKKQNKDKQNVPKIAEVVYLRENSNISTGGDSIDYTDLISEDYKNIAVKATQAAKATISGVDMIIKDITKPATRENYSIIEINFNPAIHIHCFPYRGKNRQLAKKILDKLGF